MRPAGRGVRRQGQLERLDERPLGCEQLRPGSQIAVAGAGGDDRESFDRDRHRSRLSNRERDAHVERLPGNDGRHRRRRREHRKGAGRFRRSARDSDGRHLHAERGEDRVLELPRLARQHRCQCGTVVERSQRAHAPLTILARAPGRSLKGRRSRRTSAPPEPASRSRRDAARTNRDSARAAYAPDRPTSCRCRRRTRSPSPNRRPPASETAARSTPARGRGSARTVRRSATAGSSTRNAPGSRTNRR